MASVSSVIPLSCQLEQQSRVVASLACLIDEHRQQIRSNRHIALAGVIFASDQWHRQGRPLLRKMASFASAQGYEPLSGSDQRPTASSAAVMEAQEQSERLLAAAANEGTSVPMAEYIYSVPQPACVHALSLMHVHILCAYVLCPYVQCFSTHKSVRPVHFTSGLNICNLQH